MMQAKSVYAEADITERLSRDLPAWRYEGGQLRRTYKTHGFKAAVMAANAARSRWRWNRTMPAASPIAISNWQ
jgi:pterin-4a-carbinolamine dehydratase